MQIKVHPYDLQMNETEYIQKKLCTVTLYLSMADGTREIFFLAKINFATSL